MNPDQPERTAQELLTELRELLDRADPVPAAVVSAARDSFGWRDLDAQLARLVAEHTPAGAGVRGEPSRLLTYQAGDRILELEVSQAGQRLRIIGQLVPPQPARVRAQQPAGQVEVPADRLGRFAFPDLPPGPTRFAYQPLSPDGTAPAGTETQTEWVML